MDADMEQVGCVAVWHSRRACVISTLLKPHCFCEGASKNCTRDKLKGNYDRSC